MTEEKKKNEQQATISTVSSPIELVKKDFETEYLPTLFDEIRQKALFGNPFTKKLPKDVKVPEIHHKIFDIDTQKFAYTLNFKDGASINFSKILNSVPYKIKPYHKIFNNKTVEPSTASIQIIFKTENGKLSEPVILDNKAKSSHKEFIQAIHKSNNNILCRLDDTTFLLLMEEINHKEQKTVLSFVNQGRVSYKNLTGRLYKNGYMVDGKIIPANEYDEIDLGDFYITLNKEKLAMLAEIYLGDYDVKKELHSLLTQIEKIYKGKIEPFLCLGASVFCIFLEEIWEERTGFPVVYLQGATKQGKSLIQGVVTNIFGYSKRLMSTGNSTDKAIAEKCHCLNSTMICVNDYDCFKAQSFQFENNVVHFYEAGIREKMYNGKDFNLQPINSTAMYSSNYMPQIKEKILNRLLPLYFPENGIVTKYISKNFTNDIRRSKILCEVQKFSWEKVLKLIEGAEDFILSFDIFPNKDRESNNVAIAYAGLKLLEHIADYTLPNQVELLKEYCDWYKNLIEKAKSRIEHFIECFSTLAVKGNIKENKHYKLTLVNGRIHLTFDTQECVNIFNTFCVQSGMHQLALNPKTIGYDLKACEYFVARKTCAYSGGHQASSTILDITDTVNGKPFYYEVTGDFNAQFAEKPNNTDK